MLTDDSPDALVPDYHRAAIIRILTETNRPLTGYEIGRRLNRTCADIGASVEHHRLFGNNPAIMGNWLYGYYIGTPTREMLLTARLWIVFSRTEMYGWGQWRGSAIEYAEEYDIRIGTIRDPRPRERLRSERYYVAQATTRFVGLCSTLVGPIPRGVTPRINRHGHLDSVDR